MEIEEKTNENDTKFWCWLRIKIRNILSYFLFYFKNYENKRFYWFQLTYAFFSIFFFFLVWFCSLNEKKVREMKFFEFHKSFETFQKKMQQNDLKMKYKKIELSNSKYFWDEIF